MLTEIIRKWITPSDVNIRRRRLADYFAEIEDLTKVPVEYVHDDKKALYVDTNTKIEIPSDKYVRVADGVYDRFIKHKTDIRYGPEKKWAKMISGLDFEKYINLFVKFEEYGEFRAHYHPVVEYIHCLEGSYVDTTTDQKYEAGDIQVVAPNKVHTFKALEKGYCVIRLGKNK